jgi:hypothetical protein
MFASYLGLVLLAPLLFLVYLRFDLVCLPRAALFEAATGGASILLLTLAVRSNRPILYLLPAAVPASVILITPIVMIRRLGWEKFITERVLAYATFDLIAILQLLLIAAMMEAALTSWQAGSGGEKS